MTLILLVQYNSSPLIKRHPLPWLLGMRGHGRHLRNDNRLVVSVTEDEKYTVLEPEVPAEVQGEKRPKLQHSDECTEIEREKRTQSLIIHTFMVVSKLAAIQNQQSWLESSSILLSPGVTEGNPTFRVSLTSDHFPGRSAPLTSKLLLKWRL